MSKLNDAQIKEYFSTHLPYRTRILVAHYWMTREPWTVKRGDSAWLAACFEASLIAGRMYLNALGISKNRHDQLVRRTFQDDDVSAEDLGGRLIDLATLSADDRYLFVGFLKMADKGAAHLTMPVEHPWKETHVAISRICWHLKVCLYDPASEALEGAVP